MIANFLAWILCFHSLCYVFSDFLQIRNVSSSDTKSKMNGKSAKNREEKSFFVTRLIKAHLKSVKLNLMKINLGIISTAIFLLTEDFLHFILCLMGYLVFLSFLPKLFQTFKYSFSYGEGCLCLQGLIVFLVKTILRLLKKEGLGLSQKITHFRKASN